MENKETKKENKSIVLGILKHLAGVLNNFGQWLKPDPADHWSLQVLKGIGKLPLVLFLILCSPILIVVLLLVLLIAL